MKRDHVRNIGKLDSAAVSQIAAEKLALELTSAEQLFGLVKQPEQKECVRDAHWTIQKLNWLKRKLVGEKSVPAMEQSTSFGTYCAALAERMSAVAAISSSVQRSINNGNGGGQQQQHHQYSQAINNKKNNKSHFNEMPFVVNRFYFHHDQSYPGSPFISPDKKVISLKLFDRKSQKRDKSGQTYPYYSCNRLIVAPNEKADAKNAVCNIL